MLRERVTKKNYIKLVKMKWNKPVIVAITRDELTKHIKVVARSGLCGSLMR